MFLYNVIGRTRQGKSRYVKGMITAPSTKNRPCGVYDYQNEYGDTYLTLIGNKPTKVKGPGIPLYRPGMQRWRMQEYERFLSMICEKKINDHGEKERVLKGYNYVLEEATIFLKGKSDTDIRDLCVSRFHDQNNLIFVWHELKVIPPDIVNISNYLIIFKTFDKLSIVESRFESPIITEAFLRQSRKADGAPPTIVDRYNNLIDGKSFL